MTTDLLDTLARQGELQLATFRLGGEWFAVDVLRVQEVMLPQAITDVPRAQSDIIGLINVRGLIVTVLSLKQRFAYEDTSYDAHHRCLIIDDTEDGLVCLLVDDIGDVIEVSTDQFTAGSGAGEDVHESMIGIITLPDHLLTVLAVERLIEAA